MTRAIYALLVGIDQYRYPVPPLRGCVNDITAIETLLRERIVGDDYQLNALVLKDAAATRQAIIDGFRTHLCKAGSDDVALFYYSGHGSQEKTPPEFWHLEPDKLDETLVCYDSRTTGNYDLADKELSKLIAEVAERSPHIVVILDCCHSGTGTRVAGEGSVRRAPTDERQRPLSSFIVSPSEVESLSPARSVSQMASDWVSLSQGKHIVVAACRADEEAKEYSIGGQRRGVFSYFLTDTLQQAGGKLTYRDLFKRVRALVRNSAVLQSPQIEASDVNDLDQPFLGGAVAARSAYFTLSFDQDYGWVIDGGAVHGLPPATGDETTILAFFPFNTALEQVGDLAFAQGTARVTEVLPHLSKVAVTMRDGGSPNPEHTFKAVVTSLPLPPLGVLIEGDDAGVQLARQALATASIDQRPSLYLRGVDTVAAAELRLLARDGIYRITRPSDDRPLVVDIAGYSEATARQAVQRMEHIARWTQIAELTNPASRIAPGAVRLELHRIVGPPVTRTPDSQPTELHAGGSELRLEYEYQDGTWKQPQFKIKLINTSHEPLYCALLSLTETYAVQSGLLPGGGVWLQPGEETWANNGNPIYPAVPKELWQQGITEVKDLIKLIVSTDECDATLLEQTKLDRPFVPKPVRSVGRMSTLNRLMSRVQTRDLNLQPEADEGYADWSTSEISITTVRPLDAVPVPRTGKAAALGAGITLAPHPSLQARARLTTVSQAGRDLGNLLLPPVLRDDPEVSQPLQFTASRGSDPGLSVLELTDVVDHTVVTPEQPLVLHVTMLLSEDEHILPVGYDGEFFLPLGRRLSSERGAEGTLAIELERLPAPVTNGVRDLKGSIRIFFQKVLSQRFGTMLGVEFPYPLLAAAYIDNNGKVTYWQSNDEVKLRVDDAERILLYIHGFIGDTREMAASARCLNLKGETPPPPLAERYDLILTFDYENINTTIEETARSLKQRLDAVGLGPGHDKTLHIVAHGMGGLVARWFIEREGGNQVVQHLVMLGTPNAGSPWPTIQTWAIAAIGIGLNSLAIVTWPIKVLGSLVSAFESIDVTLDQMAPNSDFFKSLNTSTDPSTAYTIIAGNTSILPPAMQPEPGEEQSRLARLMNRLSSQKFLHAATALAFFGQPNDIAVSVQSMKNIPTGRSPQPNRREVACDHLTYFSTVAGLAALTDALDPNERG